MDQEAAGTVMEEQEEKGKDVKKLKKSAISVMTEVVERELPNIPGRKRKIHHLWDNHFRVNFWDMEDGKIEPSHFVTVNEDGTCTLG